MKKLMFAAALAATGMTFAETPAAQVYDVCLNIKTTAAATATINNKTNPFLGEEKEFVIYRKEASKTWKGLIWGCDCEAIDGVWRETGTEYLDRKSIEGCVMWDTKTKQPVFMGDGSDLADVASVPGTGWTWRFINAIDKSGKKCEGVWTIAQEGPACEENDELFNFQGAGFGSLCLASDLGCTSYIKSISGNFAGWMKAPSANTDDNWSGCTFCGYQKEEGICAYATAWEYCDCYGILKEAETAAYGTWKISYNSGLSKKLSTMVNPKKIDETLIYSITEVYNFKNLPAVGAAILAVEMYMNDFDPTGCDELETALSLAKANTVAKEAAVEAVKYENLKAAEAKAAAAVTAAEAKKELADMAYEAAKASYTASSNALVKAEDAVSTNKYEILIKDADGGQIFNGPVYGSKAAAEKIAFYYEQAYKRTIKVTAYTLDRTSTLYPWVLNSDRTVDTTDLTKAWIDTNSAKWATDDAAALVKAQADYNTAKENRTTAATNLATANANLQEAKDALTAAQNDLANINLLQYKAAQDLEKAQAAEAVAQKAYDDAGCAD